MNQKTNNEDTYSPSITFTEIMPPTAFTFPNGSSISWESGELVFKGEIHSSAKAFFEYLKPMIDSYIKMNGMNNLAYLEDLYNKKQNDSTRTI